MTDEDDRPSTCIIQLPDTEKSVTALVGVKYLCTVIILPSGQRRFEPETCVHVQGYNLRTSFQTEL